MHADVSPVQPAEPFTIFNAVGLKAELLTQLDARVHGMVLDMSAVEEIDTAGVQLLLMLKREAAARGCPLSFRAFRPAVHEILDLLGLTAGFSSSSMADEAGEPDG